MNATKFTVVQVYLGDYTDYVTTFMSIEEMLQDIFFDGWEGPDDEWMEDNTGQYNDEILRTAKQLIYNVLETRIIHILYVEDGEIKELDLDSLPDIEIITAYMKTYV